MQVVSPPSAQPPSVRAQEPLASYTWFGTGGAAQWFSHASTVEELKPLLSWAHHEKMPVTILGDGANILISDEGITGLVIRPRASQVYVEERDATIAWVTANAGMKFDDLITWCLEHQLSGLEEFSGIPGRVGGCMYMNIHYFSFLLEQFVVRATVLDKTTGTLSVVDRAWFKFGYDYSTLHEGKFILLDATFALHKVSALDAAFARGRQQEIIRHRTQRYPYQGTCGSFFRNFLPDEVTLESNGRKMIYVAYYLDKLGVKGALSCGKASVSYQHANMIVAHPGATSTDVCDVARTMQEMVYNEFGILPQPECQLLGFSEYPLHRSLG